MLAALAAASMSAASACDLPPEERPFYIDRLRVLSIKTEPLVAAGGEAATVRALIRQPGAVEPKLEWSWCPYRPKASDYYKCPVTLARYKELLIAAARRFEVELAPSQLDALPAFELGSAQRASLTHGFDPTLTSGLCFLTLLAGLEIDKSLQAYFHSMPCEVGFEISYRLEIKSGQESLTTRKSAMWDVGAPAKLTNPRLMPLEIRPLASANLARLAPSLPWFDPALPLDQQWTEVDPQNPMPLVRGLVYELRVRLDLEARDPYLSVEQVDDQGGEVVDTSSPTPDPDAEEPDAVATEDGLERARMLWFTSADVLSEPKTPEGLYPEELELTWRDYDYRHLDLRPSAKLNEACADPQAICGFEVDVILRDSQLGTDWRTLRVSLKPQP